MAAESGRRAIAGEVSETIATLKTLVTRMEAVEPFFIPRCSRCTHLPKFVHEEIDARLTSAANLESQAKNPLQRRQSA